MRRVHGFWRCLAGSHLRLLTQINFICSLGAEIKTTFKALRHTWTLKPLCALLFPCRSCGAVGKVFRLLDYFLNDSMFLFATWNFCFCIEMHRLHGNKDEGQKPQNSLWGVGVLCVCDSRSPWAYESWRPSKESELIVTWLHSAHRLQWPLELLSYLSLYQNLNFSSSCQDKRLLYSGSACFSCGPQI